MDLLPQNTENKSVITNLDKPNPLKINQINRYEVTHTSVTSFLFWKFHLESICVGKLPPDHKARWFAGAALNSAEQAMASVMSTVLSRLNAFLDSELEQVLCFDSAIDAEKFASEKSAIFLILPEEDTTKNFMAGLMIQNHKP